MKKTVIFFPNTKKDLVVLSRQCCIFWGGGGQPDSDMKVDFAEIGIGKIGIIGISDFLT